MLTSSRLETQRPAASRVQDRDWWSGALMSMWEPARRSFRCVTSWLAKSCSSMTKWSVVENVFFSCSVSFSNSLTPPPERMRTPVWTWMSRFTCRNWMRWEVQYGHVSSCRSLISCSWVIRLLLCVCFRSVLLESRYWMWTAFIFRHLMLISTVSWSVIRRWEWYA